LASMMGLLQVKQCLIYICTSYPDTRATKKILGVVCGGLFPRKRSIGND